MQQRLGPVVCNCAGLNGLRRYCGVLVRDSLTAHSALLVAVCPAMRSTPAVNVKDHSNLSSKVRGLTKVTWEG